MTGTCRVKQWVLLALLAGAASGALGQQLATRFSCSEQREEDGLKTTYADSGEIRIDGNRLDAFHWESSLFRQPHGFDCSIDEDDGLQAEVRNDLKEPAWRITLANARQARAWRGYDSDHGFNCSIRLERSGDTLLVKPSCPALCGSRPNFSELSIDLKTGKCRYEE